MELAIETQKKIDIIREIEIKIQIEINMYGDVYINIRKIDRNRNWIIFLNISNRYLEFIEVGKGHIYIS